MEHILENPSTVTTEDRPMLLGAVRERSQHTHGIACCTATDSRCRRCEVDRGSCVTAAMRRPIAVPTLRMFRWQRRKVDARYNVGVFLDLLFFSRSWPLWLLLAWTYDCAKVSWQVASQAMHRPLFHGTCVTPSGRLLSLVHKECGSRVSSRQRSRTDERST